MYWRFSEADVFVDKAFPLRVDRACLGSTGFGVHSHEFLELVVISGGCGVHIAQGRSYPVSAGDVFVLQGHLTHGFQVEASLELANVMMGLARLPLPLHYLRGLPGYHALFILEPIYRQKHQFGSHLSLDSKELSEVMSIILELELELSLKRPGWEAVAVSQLTQLIVLLSRRYTSCSQVFTRSLVNIGSVMTALEVEYERQWTLTELARMACLSVNQLLRAFRMATGNTPIEYLTRTRVQKAAGMLGSSDGTITEIAICVGFSDSSYFCRRFKQVMGLTPGEYRRRLNPEKAV